ncbi:MAG: hypothetical protein ACTTI6_02540 [Treponema sp.]|uniref:hypothetical protein n=1 Tax=Treponema sp. TaxID=166 RepID=UPI003FA24ADB
MEEKEQKDKKQEKAALAKKQSRKAIIAAGVWVSVHSIMKALFPLFGAGEYGLSMSDIISSGSFFIAGWVPVYGSIWLDKIFNVPKDDEGEDKHVSEPTGFTVLGGGTCGKKD